MTLNTSFIVSTNPFLSSTHKWSDPFLPSESQVCFWYSLFWSRNLKYLKFNRNTQTQDWHMPPLTLSKCLPKSPSITWLALNLDKECKGLSLFGRTGLWWPYLRWTRICWCWLFTLPFSLDFLTLWDVMSLPDQQMSAYHTFWHFCYHLFMFRWSCKSSWASDFLTNPYWVHGCHSFCSLSPHSRQQ